MRASFAILAVTALLLLAVNAAVGLTLSGQPADGPERAAWFGKHYLLSIGAMLFIAFVHAVAYTYFIACARMARDAVDAAGMPAGGLVEIVTLRKQSLRWLLGGVLLLLAAGLLGACASLPGSVVGAGHMTVAMAAIILNALGFLRQYELIGKNVRLTDELYGNLGRREPQA